MNFDKRLEKSPPKYVEIKGRTKFTSSGNLTLTLLHYLIPEVLNFRRFSTSFDTVILLNYIADINIISQIQRNAIPD